METEKTTETDLGTTIIPTLLPTTSIVSVGSAVLPTVRPKKVLSMSMSTREEVMRRTVSALCGRPFLKVRPEFLRNINTNRCLELDAYNEELKLGCEFNGIQHYKPLNPYHITEADFETQQHRDRLKAELCIRHGVRLIVVPYTVHKESIHRFLRFQLFPNTLPTPSCVQNLPELG